LGVDDLESISIPFGPTSFFSGHPSFLRIEKTGERGRQKKGSGFTELPSEGIREKRVLPGTCEEKDAAPYST
jgi:hypothetical protein